MERIHSRRVGVLIGLLFVCLGMGSLVWQHFATQALEIPKVAPATSVALVPVHPIPILAPDATPAAVVLASVSAQSVYVIDSNSAAVLVAKNEDQALYPASTTKLLTALVALDEYQVDEIFTATTSTQTIGTVLGIVPGDRFSVRDLLAALLINSANDAAMMLAAAHPEGVPGFVTAMNQKAQELQLFSSRFSNPSGLDAVGQRSTTRELALLAREVMQQPLLAELVATPSLSIFDAGGQKQFQLQNTNALLKEQSGFVGIKTGTTDLAKEMLISQYRQIDHQVMIVVAGSDDRYADTTLLKEWVESSYTWIQPNSDTLE